MSAMCPKQVDDDKNCFECLVRAGTREMLAVRCFRYIFSNSSGSNLDVAIHHSPCLAAFGSIQGLCLCSERHFLGLQREALHRFSLLRTDKSIMFFLWFSSLLGANSGGNALTSLVADSHSQL